MGKNKRALWLATGVAVGVLLTNAAKKMKEDMGNLVDEDKELGGQTKEWFSEKKEYFKDLIEKKQEQINKITAKLKADVIKEIDEDKRKEMVQKATEKIAQLKEEIKEISGQRRDEFLYYMKKINATNIAQTASNIGTSVKKFAKDIIDKKPKTDDFDFEDFDDE